MPVKEKTVWADEDFDQLSWHDNHVHGLSIIEGEFGAGELSLDIDFILKWNLSDSSRVVFDIAPARLTFYEVINLKFFLDYESATAALVPFSIESIDRRLENREGYSAILWNIPINWPKGEISFQASGFSQALQGRVMSKDQQYLTKIERENLSLSYGS